MPIFEVHGSNEGNRDFHFCGEIDSVILSNPYDLANSIMLSMSRNTYDMLRFIEVAAFADRFVRRRRDRRWQRDIKIKVPVHRGSGFLSREISAAAVDLLTFATGDDWKIEFTHYDSTYAQEKLGLDLPAPDWILPYSAGLDSAIAYEWLSAQHGADSIYRINAGPANSKRQGQRQRQLIVAKRLFRGRGRLREATYRTRPIIFFGYAAAAAATFGKGTIVIGENGQGALGPSIARFGNEWPFRSTHPGLSRRLVNLVRILTGKSIYAEHPFKYMTKAESLKSIHSDSLSRLLSDSDSCSQRPKERHGFRMCGYCGGCLLRNVAIISAGYTPERSQAFDLRNPSLILCDAQGNATPMARSARTVFCDAVESMDVFARFCDSDDRDEVIAIEADEIDPVCPDRARKELNGLAIRHRKEWLDFLAALPPSAWLRQNYGAV